MSIFRVSGKLVDGTPFSSRINATDAVAGFVTGRKLINDADIGDDKIAEISVRPLQGKASVHFGKAKTAAEIQAAKDARAAKKAGATATPAAQGSRKR
jgi:hypothetical protein